MTTLFSTTPVVPPNDHPDVQAKGRAVEAARTALSDIERCARELEAERDSHDELRVLTAAYELSDLRQRYIGAKAALVTATRAYDEAFQHARGPWLAQAKEKFGESVRTYLDWLETDVVRANNAMLAAQAAAEAAGLHVEPLHIPHLLPDAVEHRCRIGRKGLG